MRLLRLDNFGEPSLTEDLLDNLPDYAILSHTWGRDQEEVTFDDLCNGSGKNKLGYRKIRFCGQQAREDGIEHFWVDTVCINKANQSELSEALNSMFRWYQGAKHCYVYLSDVAARKRNIQGSEEQTQYAWAHAFRNSRWFTRGWTLQELLAPSSVRFFSCEGDFLGSKDTLTELIQEVTGIPDSALLGTPLSRFSFEERMKWTDGRKTKRVEDSAYCLLGVFDVFMPPIYGEGEHAFVRLKDLIGRSYRNKLDEVGQKLTTTNSFAPNSTNVEPAPAATEEISILDRRKELLSSLSFAGMESRQNTIKRAYSTTCEWFLSHPSYRDWTDPGKLHQHHGVLWINGKPGAGKSTLVKFSHDHASRQAAEDEVLISFFFNARGDHLEKSTIGMYRSLLHQLVTKAADLQHVLDSFNYAEQQGRSFTWTIELLCEYLSALVKRLGQRRLKCFVDALDECDEEQVREMITFFEELGQNSFNNGNQFHVCFASRPYPIHIHNGLHLTLEDETGHGEDLKKYIQHHLRAGRGKYIEEVREHIRMKSNGVFMWAVLVVDILNKEFLRGRIFAVQKRLQETPAELSDLFKDTLRRDQTNMNDLLLCLQWILFAKRPLKREEFYFAMAAGLDPKQENTRAWDPEQVTVEDMNRFVLNSSKGLAELTKSKMPTVQFIHESVRDFLLKDNGLYELWPELGGDLFCSSHEQLKRCCQNYLTADLSEHVPLDEPLPKATSDAAKVLRDEISVKFPFLEYANQHVLEHADDAARAISQTSFLRSFPLRNWLNISNIFEKFEIRRHTSNASFLYIAAEKNLARLIRAIDLKFSDLNVKGERYQYPLFAAIVHGNREALQALLKQEPNSPAEDITANIEFGRAFSIPKNTTPFFWALEREHGIIAEVLTHIADGSLDLIASEGSRALDLAARVGNEKIVNVLLDTYGINVNMKIPGTKTSPLLYAAQQGHTKIIQILIDKGADIEARDPLDRTALHVAAIAGHETTIQQLVSLGANIETSDWTGRTALFSAAEAGHTTMIQQLLSLGTDLETRDRSGRTALFWEAKAGHTIMIQRLVSLGADLETRDQSGRTALFCAAKAGRITTIQQLVSLGADLEARDQSGKTALFWVAEAGYITTAQQLVSLGADLEARDQSGKTALFLAVEAGYTIMIQQLVSLGANLEATDQDGKTVLIWAAEAGRTTIIEQLVSLGANLEARDLFGKTALILAAEAGHTTIVPWLLSLGANLEARDQDRLFLMGYRL